ncbi:MAG: NADH-quinone oxidoreductase subunit N [Acidimicrobiales bacterium]|jgi:NADH-quinone oxidoreductase subunit N
MTFVAAGCTIGSATGTVSGLCTAKSSITIAINYPALVPLFLLGGGALVVLFLAAMLPKRRYPGLWAGITVLASLGTIVDGLAQWFQLPNTFTPLTNAFTIGGQLYYDHFAAFFAILFGSATLLGALLSDGYLTRENLDGPEAYVLMLACSTGALLMADAASLISLFLGLEIMSIALYTMSAYNRRRAASGEAGLKYFILGSFASAIFIYGVALIYGATGSTQYFEIIVFLATNNVVHTGVLLAGMGLVIVGLGFKVAAVPFHFWAPDVYQGAPTPFVGYMAAVAKAGGFAGLVRVLMLALPTETSNWRPIIWVLAAASVLVGGVLALVQADLKRMLAYSSISQAGYVLIGLQSGTASGVKGVCFYLFTYVFLVMGTFAVISVVQGRGEARNDLGAVRGLAARSPWLAAALLVLLLGQAGLPLTSGFLAKWVVIEAVVAKGQYELAVIGMLGAAIAAFFYLRIAFLVYSAPEPAADGADGAPAYGTSDLQAIAVAGMSGRDTALALRAPSAARIRVPAATSAVLAICVGFTIFAGVSGLLVSMTNSLSLPWQL